MTAATIEYKRSGRIIPPSQAAMDAVIHTARAEVTDLVDALAAKLIDPAEFVDHMAQHLQDAHTSAVVLGRQRAGDLAPQEWDDTLYAQHVVMQAQAEFLDGFRADLENGDSRYVDADGNWRTSAILNRALMYAERVSGTANEAFALTSEGHLLTWVLGGGDHCATCPGLAAGSPYKLIDLPTTPRSGGTACLSRCTCTLLRDDGVEGFKATD